MVVAAVDELFAHGLWRVDDPDTSFGSERGREMGLGEPRATAHAGGRGNVLIRRCRNSVRLFRVAIEPDR